MTDNEFRIKGGVFVVKKYGLSREEAEKLLDHPNQIEILKKQEDFINKNRLASSSPLSRGNLLDLIKDS